MNKRIKQLAEQSKPLDENGQKIRGLNSEYHDLWMAKFAELIVEECMDIAKYHTPDTEECEYTWLIYEKIKEHFGVE